MGSIDLSVLVVGGQSKMDAGTVCISIGGPHWDIAAHCVMLKILLRD